MLVVVSRTLVSAFQSQPALYLSRFRKRRQLGQERLDHMVKVGYHHVRKGTGRKRRKQSEFRSWIWIDRLP